MIRNVKSMWLSLSFTVRCLVLCFAFYFIMKSRGN